ncbi:MAG: hypothetical protein HY821_08930 [Acidobacteria bacterium]|nr:hypothetical protein [Acidobacteriota bacterium]
MSSIHEMKRLEVLETPLLLFECTLTDGTVERWSTHRVTAEEHVYEPRALRHSGFEMRLAGEEAVDSGARFTLTLSNVDRRVSQLDSQNRWNGAKLRVRFAFFNLQTGLPASELIAVYAGVANPVEELTETEARMSFTNRLSLQRLSVPTQRIQARCPWRFPATADERAAAVDGATVFGKCGYSADVQGGAGNLDNGAAYTACGRSREECQARGMFAVDSSGRETARFGGFTYLPPGVEVRSHATGERTVAEALDGRARSNDAVPLVYGTAWINAPVVFGRNDGNLTHCEVLLCSGPIEGVQKVIANGVELPRGEYGKDMTATGWYNVLSTGGRNGGFNLTFLDAAGKPAGDPHGGMACLAVVLPNAIVTQGRLPKVEVLLDGMQLSRYSTLGEDLGTAFTRNPSWVLLDLLKRGGWSGDEIDLQSFATAASFCDEFVEIRMPGGQTAQGPRFEVNLALTQRRSLSEVVRGVRSAAGLMAAIDEQGRIAIRPESTLAVQGASKPAGSNSTEALLGGWPAYEFGDGMNGKSAILRSESGRSTFRIWRRATSATPNRISVEFQDAFNCYQQDSLSLVDFEDAAAQGCEIAAASSALGLPHVDQAARIVRLELERGIAGNRFVEFESSVQALGLRPGDLIAISHSREGMDRTVFRVLKVAPALNFERVKIVAQLHKDEWYLRASGDWQDRFREALERSGIPRPLAGRVKGLQGEELFEVAETNTGGLDQVELAVRFGKPAGIPLQAGTPPVVSLKATIAAGGGSLAGGEVVYYAVSGVDPQGIETALSFVVQAALPVGVGYSVALEEIRCATGQVSMRIYRGSSAWRLRRIADTAAAARFVDTGLEASLAPPPDANYDHALFRWRFEQLPETSVEMAGASSLGKHGLGLLPNEFTGSVVRITKGKGAGQEKLIASHTAEVIEVSEPWREPPDGTSWFTIAEGSWKPAGITSSDEIRMLVPNRPGEVVQVLGTAVSAAGAESGDREAIVHRHRIEGDLQARDADVPPEPVFGLATSGQGTLEIAGIGFPTLVNTVTVRSGTLTLHYWNEVLSPCQAMLSSGVDDLGQTLAVSGLAAAIGDLLQVEGELVRVLEASGGQYLVDRGCHGTPALAHGAAASVYRLSRRTVVLPFSKGFFGSSASGSYSQSIDLANARVAAAELFMTNDRGNGPTGALAFTMTAMGGLRTMSGGQYSMQYEGELAVMDSIAPELVVESTRVVLDVRARLGVAPIAEPVAVRVLVNDVLFASLVVTAGARNSNAVSGFGKAALREGDRIRAQIESVGLGGGSYPGRDLTVTVRL